MRGVILQAGEALIFDFEGLSIRNEDILADALNAGDRAVLIRHRVVSTEAKASRMNADPDEGAFTDRS